MDEGHDELKNAIGLAEYQDAELPAHTRESGFREAIILALKNLAGRVRELERELEKTKRRQLGGF